MTRIAGALAAPPRAWLVAVAAVAVAWLTALVAARWLAHPAPFLLAAVLLAALRGGLGPALAAALLAAAVEAFGFGRDALVVLADLAAFALVAAATGRLADALGEARRGAGRREAMLATLHGFGQRLAGIADANEVHLAIVEQLGALTGRQPALLLPLGDGLATVAASLRDRMLADAVLDAARALMNQGGERPPSLVVDGAWLRQLRTGHGAVGVLVVPGDAAPAIEGGPLQLDALLDVAALAIERTRLARAIEDARVARQAEQLRDALLDSVSHDLRTPLAAILGSATSLQAPAAAADGAARDELVATIREEAERLDGFVGNVLELSRLRAGGAAARTQWTEVSDVVESALRRARRALAGREVAVALPRDPPLLRIDPFLIEHALVNLLENAGRFGPAGSTVAVAAELAADGLAIAVSDQGPGVPSAEAELVFERFYRGRRAADGGTGLGLAICRAFVDANGGRVEVASGAGGVGATFRIVLPVPPQPAESPVE